METLQIKCLLTEIEWVAKWLSFLSGSVYLAGEDAFGSNATKEITMMEVKGSLIVTNVSIGISPKVDDHSKEVR